jgi:hypothetical protein
MVLLVTETCEPPVSSVRSSVSAGCPTCANWTGVIEAMQTEADNTQASYDRVAKAYADYCVNEFDHKPLDRRDTMGMLKVGVTLWPIWKCCFGQWTS